MNCFKCGASVTGEHKNCPFCGQSMQIVPDYSFLDDDNINVMMEESAISETEKNVDKEAADRIRKRKKQEREREKQRRLERKKQRQMILIFIAVVVVCGLLFTAFFAVNDMIQTRNENSYDYQVKQAENALKNNDFVEAQEYYYKALSLKPTDLEVRFKLAELFAQHDMTNDMIAMYKEILRVDSQNYTAYKMLFQHYNSQGDVEAILELREGVTDNRIMALFQDYAVENPTIYLKGGTYNGAINVMITSKLTYEIYYTIDGSDPTKNGVLYNGTIHIDKSGMTTLKAVSKNEKGVYSNVMQETYYIVYKAPDDPIITLNGQTLDTTVSDTIVFDTETYLEVIVPTGCTAYYAWDLDERVVDIRLEGSNRLAYVDGIRVPSGEHKLTLVIIDDTSGLSSEKCRVYFKCTVPGIPVPEQFINQQPDVSEDYTTSEDDITIDEVQ